MRNIQSLAEDLYSRLKANAEPGRSAAMSAYMKNLFPFLGVNSPKRRELFRSWKRELPSLTHEELRALIDALWKFPERELHYCAIDLFVAVPLKAMQKEDDRFIEQLISSNSWWDSVDTIASNVAGKYLLRFPEERDRLIGKWRSSANMWLKRTCLIYQLKYGTKTDFKLMSSLIREFSPIKEFFIQKAIGWSLRQYSKSDPKAVRDFLNEHELKGIALKEASKYI